MTTLYNFILYEKLEHFSDHVFMDHHAVSYHFLRYIANPPLFGWVLGCFITSYKKWMGKINKMYTVSVQWYGLETYY